MIIKQENKLSLPNGLFEDYFLKKIFQKNCYSTNNKKFIKYFKKSKNSFLFLKTSEKLGKKILNEKKIKFLGKNFTFQKKIDKSGNYTKKKNITYKINLTKQEKIKVVNIAYKNFKYSRFHLDERLSFEKSNLIKKKTLQNYFLGLRGDKLIVQLNRKEVSGFCLLIFKNSKIAIIDLICIDKNFVKKGLASDLLLYTVNYLKKLKKEKIIVGTQESNLAAIRLYNAAKFNLKNKTYLYHYIS